MQCSNCGFDNPAGMKFCGECGVSLKNLCPHCEFENPPNFKFCGQCGQALTPRPKSEPASVPAPASGPDRNEAERRHLTVMFCDLVDSTALSEKLDPEELRRLIRAYQEVCVAVVARFEGHVAQYLGDGILVYFGYPLAHEDDVQRAVRAGLGILEAIERLNIQMRQEMGLSIRVRLGVDTGLVVVGHVGGSARYEALALGDAPNVAARLQGLAGPNSLVISAVTYRLVQGYFECEALGSHSLKGVSQPVAVYRVLHERDIRDRLEASAAAGLTPLVGRSQELALLLSRWEQVKEGRGHVILLNGEAGIGKSRLLYALKEQLRAEPHTWLESHCSPYHQNSALYPIIELLQQVLRFERADSPPEKLGKLEAALARRNGRARHANGLTETVPLLASLLSVPLGAAYTPVSLLPQRQKQRTLELVLSLLLAQAASQPLLFIIEDLHWVDPSTLELLTLLIDQGSTAPLLALFSFRPTFSPAWTSRSHVTQLTLSRLTRRQVEQMVQQVSGGQSLPLDLLRQVVSKTDGVPLFVEELTKMVLELNLLRDTAHRSELAGALPDLTIPATLHDSLMARLDRLAAINPQSKEIAQLAATLGREFSYELLQAVSELDEPSLSRDLAQLVELELLYQRGLLPYASYIFKHALLQEAAYRSLLRSRRQQYHRRIAEILAGRFPETAELQPELLAHHYTAAGLSEPAIACWQRAGQRAIEHSANLEAIEHLSRGLTLLETLPETVERLQQQLTLLLMLGAPLLVTRGYGSPEVERVYARAWQLCRQLGETPQLSSALFGLWVFYLVRADYQMASQLGEQLLALARRRQDPMLLREAHQVQGITQFYQGELVEARANLEQALDLYDPEQRSLRPSYSGADQRVACYAHLAVALWLLGYPDLAIERSERAIALAEKLTHPFSQAFALSLAALLHQYRREGPLAEQRADAAIACSTEQGFELLLGFSRIFKGWAMVEQGRAEAGALQIRQGLEAFQATGAELGLLHFLALLAEAQGRAGQLDAGLRRLAEAIATAHQNGERFYEAELYRLQGELLLKHGADQAEAEASFQRAVDVARRQQARSLELRASLSLSRLWAGQGKPAEARALLAGVYNWFTEGFDTADLAEAAALLQEWGSAL
ncbi:MAG: AAA family ATPase [Chloroflexota bacterium]